jgi:hypothetical protein
MSTSSFSAAFNFCSADSDRFSSATRNSFSKFIFLCVSPLTASDVAAADAFAPTSLCEIDSHRTRRCSLVVDRNPDSCLTKQYWLLDKMLFGIFVLTPMVGSLYLSIWATSIKI